MDENKIKEAFLAGFDYGCRYMEPECGPGRNISSPEKAWEYYQEDLKRAKTAPRLVKKTPPEPAWKALNPTPKQVLILKDKGIKDIPKTRGECADLISTIFEDERKHPTSARDWDFDDWNDNGPWNEFFGG